MSMDELGYVWLETFGQARGVFKRELKQIQTNRESLWRCTVVEIGGVR
jgi:hypothetical protein